MQSAPPPPNIPRLHVFALWTWKLDYVWHTRKLRDVRIREYMRTHGTHSLPWAEATIQTPCPRVAANSRRAQLLQLSYQPPK